MWCMIALFLGTVAGYWIDKDELPWKREVTKCQAPPVTVVNVTLDIMKGEPFPEDGLKKALKKISKIKGLKRFLAEDQTLLKESIKLESSFDYYPACLYKKMCSSSRVVVIYRPVLNTNYKYSCWNIQPVIWTTCEHSLVEDFSCVDTDLTQGYGYVCLPGYARQSVWVYCDTPKNPIRVMQIYIPFECSVSSYCCSTQ